MQVKGLKKAESDDIKKKVEEPQDHSITGIVLTELETLKLQNLAKDIQIYQLQAQQVLGQKQGELQKQIADLKQKYALDGEWEINPEGTKFVKRLADG